MGKKLEVKRRGKYMPEFKHEAVRLVKAGQDVAVTASVLDVAKQTLSNWVRLAEMGTLQGAGQRAVSAELLALAWLRAELLGVKLEREILKKATAYFARESL